VSWKVGAGIIAFLAGLAIFSRLISIPNGPDLITSAINMFTNFFRGAFDK
jgi:hypothetical protein